VQLPLDSNQIGSKYYLCSSFFSGLTQLLAELLELCAFLNSSVLVYLTRGKKEVGIHTNPLYL